MDTQARVGDGDISIVLDGETKYLVPTFGAAQVISRMHGGIRGAVDKVMQLDLDTIAQVIAAGLGYIGNRRPPEDLHEQIWRSGLTDNSGGIVVQVALYLNTLANGGRPPRENGAPRSKGEGAGDGAENPQRKSA